MSFYVDIALNVPFFLIRRKLGRRPVVGIWAVQREPDHGLQHHWWEVWVWQHTDLQQPIWVPQPGRMPDCSEEDWRYDACQFMFNNEIFMFVLLVLYGSVDRRRIFRRRNVIPRMEHISTKHLSLSLACMMQFLRVGRVVHAWSCFRFQATSTQGVFMQ